MARASAELAALGARLKVAGDAGIKREVRKTLVSAAQPVVPKLRSAARDALPKRGGLNAYVSEKKIGTSVSFTPRRAGVRVQMKQGRSGQRGNPTNSGSWRHPVFGHADRWVTETYQPAKGWWDKTVEANAPGVRAHMRLVLQEIAVQVQGRI